MAKRNSFNRQQGPSYTIGPSHREYPVGLATTDHATSNSNQTGKQIQSFADAQCWAAQIVSRHRKKKLVESYEGEAAYMTLNAVFLMAHRLRAKNRIEDLHKSCVVRLRKTNLQQRSDYAVVLLLLALEDDKAFNRHVRGTMARALVIAGKKGVEPKFLTWFFMQSGGYHRVK